MDFVEYVAGPMRGYENFNFNAFETAAVRRRALGHTVISPHDIDQDEGTVKVEYTDVLDCATHKPCRYYTHVEWIAAETVGTIAAFQRAMRADIRVLTECDGIYMLPGWQFSEGAKIEHQVAEWLGLTITYAPDAYDPNTLVSVGANDRNWDQP